mgnify:CR=1 FL=1
MFDYITQHLGHDLQTIEAESKSLAQAIRSAWEHSMLHSILLNICSLTQDPKKRLEAAFVAGYQHGQADSRLPQPEAQPTPEPQPQPAEHNAESA